MKIWSYLGKKDLQHYRNGDLGSTLKPSAAEQAPLVVKILCSTDVLHTRGKTLLQDVTNVKHICQNFVSRLVPRGRGNKIACHEMGFRKNVTTWSVLKPWHDTFPQQSRQASKCFFFCHISNTEGNKRSGILGVHLTFGEMSFSVVPRCLSILIVLAALDCLSVPS